MEMVKEHKKAVIREATVPDLRRMVKLVERLIRIERDLGDNSVIEDGQTLNESLTEYLADALFSTDKKILLIEKSGNVLGIFVLEIEERSPVFTHRRVCNLWIMYAKKNPVFIKRIFEEMEAWARDNQCTFLKGGVIIGNKRVQKIVKILGYKETHITFEKEV